MNFLNWIKRKLYRHLRIKTTTTTEKALPNPIVSQSYREIRTAHITGWKGLTEITEKKKKCLFFCFTKYNKKTFRCFVFFNKMWSVENQLHYSLSWKTAKRWRKKRQKTLRWRAAGPCCCRAPYGDHITLRWPTAFYDCWRACSRGRKKYPRIAVKSIGNRRRRRLTPSRQSFRCFPLTHSARLFRAHLRMRK